MVVVWAVVDVVVSQLSVPPQVPQTVGPQKHQQRSYKNCGSLNVDLVVVWAVAVVFVDQLSVPPQVAQTVGPQKRQPRPTKTAVH